MLIKGKRLQQGLRETQRTAVSFSKASKTALASTTNEAGIVLSAAAVCSCHINRANICFLLQIGQGLGFGCSAGPGNPVKFRGSLANQVDRARSSSKIVGMDEAQQIATS